MSRDPKTGSRNGVSTIEWAVDPTKLYVRIMYAEWFFGPFTDDASVRAAIRQLDERDPRWTDGGAAMCRGAYDQRTLKYEELPGR